MRKHRSYIGYQIFSHLIKWGGNLYFGGKILNKENIPKKGAYIFAGNHLCNYDAYLLYKATNRPIHFVAKKELLESKFAWFFRLMHLIPVDRNAKNPEAKKEVLNLLERGKIVCIFPEGTFHKEDVLLPFKPGVISFAEKSGVPIIPFAMKNDCHFRCNPTISFGKPIYINKIKEEDKLKYLENLIRKMVINLDKKKN